MDGLNIQSCQNMSLIGLKMVEITDLSVDVDSGVHSRSNTHIYQNMALIYVWSMKWLNTQIYRRCYCWGS